jgi:tetratricopeptide (TPR) repeat protein
MPPSSINATIATLYQAGITALQARRFVDAENFFRQVLQQDGRHADAYHMLGIVKKHKGERNDAEALIRQALALREDPYFLANLGDILRETNRLGPATESYRRALQLKPDFTQMQYNLALLHHLSNDLIAAEAAYRRLLVMQPDHVFTLYNLAKLLKEGAHLLQAERAYLHALAIDPQHDYAYNNLANIYQMSGRPEAAESALKKALILTPANADALFNLGNLLRESQRIKDAKQAYHRAISVKPDDANTHNNLGNLLKEDDDVIGAEAAYRRALALNPNSPDALNNLGNVLGSTDSQQEAETSLRLALDLRDDFPDARYNLATLLLAQGRLREAWSYHEARYHPRARKAIPIPNLPFPQWRGESLAGKSLLICTEQGFGDFIQFVRYAPLLKQRGVSRLTLFCAAPLKPLLETVHGVDAVATDFAAIGNHDFWVLPLSLPLHFDTSLETIPNALPYVETRKDRELAWQSQLPNGRPRVGLVWRGNAIHENDQMRSLPSLQTLTPLLHVAGIAFISLQKGQGENEAEEARSDHPILPLGNAINDFADTAAVINQLDLIISVDTAVVHLAGALGKRCWVLLPKMHTDWRWLTDRSDSPWYPGVMRLFRQGVVNDWSGVINEVTTALLAWRDAQPTPSR